MIVKSSTTMHGRRFRNRQMTIPRLILPTNVGGTVGLLEALRRRGGGRLVFPSSGGTVYGRLTCIPVPEDHPLQPITAYGAAKVAVEVYLGFYRALYGIDCRVARLSNPFGVGAAIASFGRYRAHLQSKSQNCEKIATHNEPVPMSALAFEYEPAFYSCEFGVCLETITAFQARLDDAPPYTFPRSSDDPRTGTWNARTSAKSQHRLTVTNTGNGFCGACDLWRVFATKSDSPRFITIRLLNILCRGPPLSVDVCRAQSG